MRGTCWQEGAIQSLGLWRVYNLLRPNILQPATKSTKTVIQIILQASGTSGNKPMQKFPWSRLNE